MIISGDLEYGFYFLGWLWQAVGNDNLGNDNVFKVAWELNMLGNLRRSSLLR
jgi:hypothetical protein